MLVAMAGCSTQLPERGRPQSCSGMFGDFNARDVDELAPAPTTPEDEEEIVEQETPATTPSSPPSAQEDEQPYDEGCETQDPIEEPPAQEFESVYPCFSYLDCPNHEACNVVNSTCYSCTESWQCNNQYDLEQTGPSFCCTAEDVNQNRCFLIGTCQD